jgi:ABC-type phosphate transport system permease subunit
MMNKDINKRQKNYTAFDISGRIYSYISMAMIICVFSFILIVVFRYGWRVLSFEFLTTEPNPSAINTDAGGILTPMIGTFILTIIGIIIAFPFALATAIYLCFYAKKGTFKTMVKSAVDILAGVPTVVVALFALAIFTLPQMGFLSVQVDTRRNALSGTELVFIYADEIYKAGGIGDWDESILAELEEFNESAGYWNAFGEWVAFELDEVDGIQEIDEVYEVDLLEFEFEQEQFEIRVAFANNLDINMTAQQCAEIISDAFNRAVAEKGISGDKLSAESVNGKVIVKVGESSAEPLIFYSSTSEAVEKVLGMTPDEKIYPGEQRVFDIDASLLVDGTVRSFGRSFLVAGITMAVMILPFVIKSMEEALKSVPSSYIDAALALGASKWRTIHKIVLRAARDGLVTGVILGMGRIVGDTAIVWLTLGGSIRMTGAQPWFLPENWLSTLRSGGGTLTTYIYWTSPAGEGNQFDVAFGASIVLIAIIILLNIAASVIGKAGIKKHG